MGCPQCQSDEISPSGACLICGYRPAESSTLKPEEGKAPSAAAEYAGGYSGVIEIDYAGSAAETPESDLPKWRQELSQRLSEIKQKRVATEATRPERQAPSTPVPQAKPVESLSALQARLLERMPIRKPPPPFAPPPRQRTLESLAPESGPSGALSKPTNPREIQNLIDSAVSRQVPLPKISSSIDEFPRGEPDAAPDQEGKLILLSRTLSGLIDLILVVLCTGVLLLAADFLSKSSRWIDQPYRFFSVVSAELLPVLALLSCFIEPDHWNDDYRSASGWERRAASHDASDSGTMLRAPCLAFWLGNRSFIGPFRPRKPVLS